MSSFYEQDNQIWAPSRGENGPMQLTNFTARIVKELIYHDGPATTTNLVISGKLGAKEEPLPEVEVSAAAFATMGWVNDKWGMKPIIYPAPSAERLLRTAIQQLSEPETVHVYTATGWSTRDDQSVYVTLSGAIGKDGLDTAATVRLPAELSRYRLPEPKPNAAAFTASIGLAQLTRPELIVPLLIGTYRAAICPADFAFHLAGKTGTFKSETASLLQSHYGPEMDARHLPASWSSTPNALEALAYRAKDTIMVLDDFVPVGTAWQMRQMQNTADRIIRAAGNQAGRSRLTDISSMQVTFYPRGCILSTGEDVPEQQSIRARMLIVELSAGDIPPANLTKAQSMRPLYSEAMADWIKWLAAKENAVKQLKDRSNQLRDRCLDIGHSRTPPILGDLMSTAEMMGQWARDRHYLDDIKAAAFVANCQAAIMNCGAEQQQYLATADPVESMIQTIRELLGTQKAHVCTINGGVPKNAEECGWTVVRSDGAVDAYKKNGTRLGWLNTSKGEFLLDDNMIPFIQKHGGQNLQCSSQTLRKRIKESGVMTRANDSQQRNTVRVTCEGSQRNVIAIDLEVLFPQDDEPKNAVEGTVESWDDDENE